MKSLTVRNPNDFMAPALIRMGTPDRLTINFDIPGDQHNYLRYRLRHLNADGTPSRLLESEFTSGFNEGIIDDFAYSSNTFVHYVNYNLEIPNDDVSILASGNYVIEIFDEEEPESVLAEIPFSVSEDKAVTSADVTTHTDHGYNTEFQQLRIEVDAGRLGNINPYRDLIVTVMQNNRPETLKTLSHPLRVESGKVLFEHSPELIFEAGNEYRRFETVRADYAGMSVDSVKFYDNHWHAWLAKDEDRTESPYIYDSTQHGRFMIDEYNATDPDLGADYITVHFTLDTSARGGDIYIDGDLSGHRNSDFNKMTYDARDGLYHGEMLLKQGSYNYQYVFVPYGEEKGKPSKIEGNKYETRNEYLVRVYLREPGSRGDRLIGHTVTVAN